MKYSKALAAAIFRRLLLTRAAFVRAKPMSVKIHPQGSELISVPTNTKTTEKIVSWRDIYFHVPLPAFHSSILDPLRIQATAE
jgi:hypothetical protein